MPPQNTFDKQELNVYFLFLVANFNASTKSLASLKRARSQDGLGGGLTPSKLTAKDGSKKIVISKEVNKPCLCLVRTQIISRKIPGKK